jgi:nucleotide-binding universal stress UspA family protein
MLQLQTILHPTDFSSQSEYAFRLAWSLAKDHGAKLIIAHVMKIPVVYGEATAVVNTEAFRHELTGKLRQLQGPDQSVRLEHRLAEGEAASEIIRIATEANCDLIVMGTHGRTGFGRLLMGSVAEQVMRKAPCPVLTVKAPVPQAETVPSAAPAATVPANGPQPIPH